jgi:hypothetical protein
MKQRIPGWSQALDTTLLFILAFLLVMGTAIQAAPKKAKAPVKGKATKTATKTTAKKTVSGPVLGNVTINGNGGRVVITLVTSGQPRFKAFQLEDPYRLVVHILGASTQLKDTQFREMDPLKGVRYGVWSDKPERVQSVVFDMTGLATFQARQAPNYIQLVLTGVNASFPDWIALPGGPDTTGAALATAVNGKVPPPLPADSLRNGMPVSGLVSTELQRKFVDYDDGGRRDPFVEILQKTGVEFGQMPLPRLDELRAVGVSGRPGDYVAFMEDPQGFGYALREGTPIRDGKVVKITPLGVTFLISEGDWSRQITVVIPKNEDKQ